MNGLFYGGLADGFTRGLIASRGLMLDEQNLQRQRERDAAADSMRREEMEMKREELQLRRDDAAASRANEATRIDLAAQGLGLDRDKLKADQHYKDAAVGLDRDKLALDRDKTSAEILNLRNDNDRLAQDQALKEREDKRAQEKFDFEVQQAKKLEARRNIGVVAKQIEDGALSRDGYEVLKTALGYDPGEFFLNGKADEVLRTVEGVRAGKLKPDAPEVGAALDSVFSDYLKRGVGEKLPDGAQILGKRYAGLVPAHDKPGYFAVELEVSAEKDGKPYTYRAPLTIKGSADPNDQAVLLHGDELERPFAVMLGLNANPRFKEQLNALVAQGANDPKTAAEIEKIKAQTREADAKAKAQTSGGKKQYKTLENISEGGISQKLVEVDPATGKGREVQIEGSEPPAAAPATQDVGKAVAEEYRARGLPMPWRR